MLHISRKYDLPIVLRDIISLKVTIWASLHRLQHIIITVRITGEIDDISFIIASTYYLVMHTQKQKSAKVVARLLHFSGENYCRARFSPGEVSRPIL